MIVSVGHDPNAAVASIEECLRIESSLGERGGVFCGCALRPIHENDVIAKRSL